MSAGTKKLHFLGVESKVCENCGNEFFRDTRCTWAYWARAKFCSRECFGDHHAKTAPAKRPDMATVFNRQVEKTCGCWIWTGLKDKDGYGLMPYAKKVWRANIVALKLDGREPPRGEYACHTCDTPACVNPAHLYPGTPTQNSADAIERGRICQGERCHQAKLTTAAVLEIRKSAETHEELARRFGVSRAAVSLAAERKTWRHIP